jgi:hypothetical protein
MRLLLFLIIYSAYPDLAAYRKLLDDSLENKAAAKQFYEQMQQVKESDEPVLLGFRAMSELMLCKHLLNPMSKLSHFNRGRDLLESAIKRTPKDPELLFFRLSTQSNVPSILRYSRNINEDKLLLIGYLKAGFQPGQDKALYKRIKDYLLINQHCSAKEKAMIKTL